LRNERYAEALPLFQQAAAAYAQLAEQIAAQLTEQEQPTEEVTPEPAETPAISAEQAIRQLIERFRQAFEAEDLTRMAAEVYKGEVPRGSDRRDARFLGNVFEAAEELSVAIRVDRLRIEEASAVADVQLDMGFRQARTRDPGERGFKLRLGFVPAADGWRLTRLEWR